MWAIFVISILGLFLELMLIRWVATEVRIFAYLQNMVLVVCFLGLGCLSCRGAVKVRDLLVALLTLLVLLAVPITRKSLGRISWLLSVLDDFVIWGQTPRQHPINPDYSPIYCA